MHSERHAVRLSFKTDSVLTVRVRGGGDEVRGGERETETETDRQTDRDKD